MVSQTPFQKATPISSRISHHQLRAICMCRTIKVNSAKTPSTHETPIFKDSFSSFNVNILDFQLKETMHLISTMT
jgi:hypothetical protein